MGAFRRRERRKDSLKINQRCIFFSQLSSYVVSGAPRHGRRVVLFALHGLPGKHQQPEGAFVRAISVKELEHLHNFMSILNLEPKFRQCSALSACTIASTAIEAKLCMCVSKKFLIIWTWSLKNWSSHICRHCKLFLSVSQVFPVDRTPFST